MLRVLIFSSHYVFETLSYYWDWFSSLSSYPEFDGDVVNTADKRRLSRLLKRRKRSYDVIFFPYGFFHQNKDQRSRGVFSLLEDIGGTKVYFLENEYRLLNHKLAHALSLSADYVTTQLPKDVADRAYAPFFQHERIISLPHAINTDTFRNLDSSFYTQERDIDIAFGGDPYPYYLGHRDRESIAEFFKEHAEEYHINVSLNTGREKRLDRHSWLKYLFRSKGILGHESGTNFLETNDSTREKVNKYKKNHPDVTFEEIYKLFFKNYSNPISGRAISSRHFEAIGAKTCQIMFPGRFNDILKADEHYIALNRDYSNIDDVMERFRDVSYRQKMVDQTYEYVMDCHTHRHRIAHLLACIQS